MGGRGTYLQKRREEAREQRAALSAGGGGAAEAFVAADGTPTTVTETGGRYTEFASANDGSIGHAWADTEFKSWEAGLSPSVKLAWKDYSDGAYTPMNTIVRGKDTSSYDEGELKYYNDKIKAMDAGMTHRLSRNIVTYRGTNVSDSAKFAEMTKIGAEWSESGFMSTSFSKATAKKFIKSWKDNPVMFTVQIPKGVKAGYMDSVRDHNWENELIPERGRKVKVLKDLGTIKVGNKLVPHYLIRFI